MEAQSSSSSNKARTVVELQAAKRLSGKTYGQIAEETGLTNVYVAQLLRRQAQLKPQTAPLLRAALPALNNDHVLEMMQPPLRSYDPNLIQDPTVYSHREDVCLCRTYMDASQDPATGRYYSADEFWLRVTMTYNTSRDEKSEEAKNLYQVGGKLLRRPFAN